VNDVGMRLAWRDWEAVVGQAQELSREIGLLADYVSELPRRRSVLPLVAYATGVSLATLRLSGCYSVTAAVKHGAAWCERVGRCDDGDWLATLAHDDEPNEELRHDVRDWIASAESTSRELAAATVALIAACDAAQRPGSGRPLDPEPVA
jgi:hypothetical protein